MLRYYYVGSVYCNIKFVQSLVTKRNLIHTLDAPDYKAHVPFLKKLKDYKRALWSENYGNTEVNLNNLATFSMIKTFQLVVIFFLGHNHFIY